MARPAKPKSFGGNNLGQFLFVWRFAAFLNAMLLIPFSFCG
jgi:hypothetical protein